MVASLDDRGCAIGVVLLKDIQTKKSNPVVHHLPRVTKKVRMEIGKGEMECYRTQLPVRPV